MAWGLGVGLVWAAEPPAADASGTESRVEVWRRPTEIWADVPEYLALLNAKRHVTAPPKLTHSVTPEYPPVYLAVGAIVDVDVALVVDAQGRVEAARVESSGDSHFDASALAAVKQWTFTPCEVDGAPAKAIMRVPISFKGAGARVLPLEIACIPIKRIVNFRNPGELSAEFNARVKGPGTGQIRATRFTVTKAIDDAGHALTPSPRRPFLKTAVGSTSSRDFEPRPGVEFDVTLTGLRQEAQALHVFEGNLEVVYADADPAAAVTVSLASSELGRPVMSPALAENGVRLEVLDARAYDARVAETHDDEGGLTEYGIGVSNAKAMTAGMTPEARAKLLANQEFMRQMSSSMQRPKLEAGDIAMAIVDPDTRLAAFEFFDADGHPLRYNRNGWFHSEHGHGTRFDIYRMEGGIPPGAKFVCWLATKTSCVVLPLHLPDVPIAEK